MKKLVALALVMVLALSLLTACGGNDNNSTGSNNPTNPPTSQDGDETPGGNDNTPSDESIAVNKIEGGNASVAKDAKLSAGDTVTTGAGTYVYLQLDDDSILKMDENSEIKISELEKGKLRVNLVKGAVLVNERKKASRDFTIGAGDTTLTVKGTFFTVSYSAGADAVVDLLDGKIDVTPKDGETKDISPGTRVTVSGGNITTGDIDISAFSAFTKEAALEYKGDLSNSCLSEDDFIVLQSGGDTAPGDNTPGEITELKPPSELSMAAFRKAVSDAGYTVTEMTAEDLTTGTAAGFTFVFKDGSFEAEIAVVEMISAGNAEMMAAFMLMEDGVTLVINDKFITYFNPEKGVNAKATALMETLLGAKAADPDDWDDDDDDDDDRGFNDPDGGAAFAALKQAAEAAGYTVAVPEYPYSGFMAPVDSIRSFRFTYSYTKGDSSGSTEIDFMEFETEADAQTYQQAMDKPDTVQNLRCGRFLAEISLRNSEIVGDLTDLVVEIYEAAGLVN